VKRGPLKVFYSYAHEDEALRARLDEHLELLARQNLVVRWHDRHISAGTEWNEVIGDALASADIVLLLVSKAFMASEYIRSVEIPEAMKVHDSGSARVVPVLLEPVDGAETLPFSKIQMIPSEAKPISDWDDSAKALMDVARSIRRIAREIIVAGGGPFEFGPHEFSEAELAVLPSDDREWVAANLSRLREALHREIPARSYEANLVVATWALRNFGRPGPLPVDLPESLFYMAQIISAFDLVALQEVDRDLGRLDALREILGPDWTALLTDVAPDVRGNRERFAILYYKPRVDFRNFSSQVIVPPNRGAEGARIAVEQFARPPLLAAFRSAGTEFQICTAHIVFGGAKSGAASERLEEVRKLGQYLERRSRLESADLLLLGDFQMGERESPILNALRESGVEIPDELLHPSNFRHNKYYDLIGYASRNRAMPLGPSRPRSGTFDIFSHVFRDDELEHYQETKAFRARRRESRAKAAATSYRLWTTFLLSDHLPLWAELEVEPTEDIPAAAALEPRKG